jgi:hypothetical protein
MAEDQHPVEPRVGHVGQNDGENNGRGPAQRLKGLPEHDEEQEWKDARDTSHGIRGRQRDHWSRLARHRQHGTGHGKQHHDRDRQEHRHEDSALDCPGYRRRIPGPDCLGRYRVQHHQGSHAEHGQGEKVEIAQGHSGEGLGRDVAHHDGVDDAHGHQADLDRDDRKREPEHGAKLGPPGHHSPGRRNLHLTDQAWNEGRDCSSSERGRARSRSAKSSRSANSVSSERRLESSSNISAESSA